MRNDTDLYFLPKSSCVARYIAQSDWSQHSLGVCTTWPSALKTNLALLLRVNQPMVLWWGPKLHQFANDAFLAASTDANSLATTGLPARVCWSATWPTVQPFAPFKGYLPAPRWDLTLLAAALAGDCGAHELSNLNYSPLFDQDGHLCAGVAVCERLTFSQKAQLHVHDVLKRMSDSFFMVDSNWMIVAVNDQHVRLTKMSREYQLGKSFLDLFLYTPDAKKSQYYKVYSQVMVENAPHVFEDYYAPLELWTACHVYPTPDGGFAVFCRDVTAVKKANEALAREKQKFETIFANSPIAMALLRGDELLVERCNAGYTRLIGDRDIVGKCLDVCLTELRDEPYFGILRNVLKTGESYVTQEQPITLISNKGCAPQKRYLDFSYTRIKDVDDRPYGIFIQAQDVTDRVMARLELVSALQARDELLSICSHELKTPVSSMKLSTQMFKRGLQRNDPRTTSPERVIRMVEQSDRQLDRLIRLIEEMLDFSRISAGRLRLIAAPCDLPSIVTETLERLQPQLDAAGAQATLEVPKSATGLWDAFRLEQLLTNLVTNALKYGGGKPIRVALEENEKHVTLKVCDQGPGISAADQERIFMPYERAVSVSNISGLGLGLYISRQIVEAHGGSIGVQSALGAGATFVVELPKRAKHLALKKGAS